MRIAIINQPWSDCPPGNSSDSIALIIYELARRLAKMPSRFSHVRSYGRTLPGRPDVETLEGVEFRRVGAPLDSLGKPLRLLDKWNISRPGKPFCQSVFYHLQYAWRVARDLQRSPCDIIHTHNFPQCARVIRRLNPSAKIVLHMHCDWLAQLDEKFVENRLDDVDLVLGVSDYITQRARSRFHKRPEMFRTLHNGADLKRFGIPRPQPPGTGKRILFVGRISPEKGVHTLLQAFARIAGRHSDATLDLAGPVSVLSREFLDPARENPVFERLDHFFRDREKYLPYLKGILADPAVAARVRFLGGLPQEDLARYYSEADLFVLPSVFDEPFGMPLAEAMACGTPCVATIAGAFPEIVDHRQTGLLVKRDDPEMLAEAMLEILQNPQIARSMGVAGKSRAQRYFDWHHLTEELAEHYAQITSCDRKSDA